MYRSKIKLAIVLSGVMAALLALAVGCAADEAAPAAAPAAPQAPAAAAAAAKAAPVSDAQVKAPAAPAPAAPAVGSQLAIQSGAQPKAPAKSMARDAPMGAAQEGYKYVPPTQEVPGVFWDYNYTGPKPSQFSENPKFAAMVKAGKLPPVEQRLPEEILVMQPPHGIGTYGGTWRITATGGGPRKAGYWDKKNSDEVSQHIPHVGFYSISEDGR